jgi:hypothetical protein
MLAGCGVVPLSLSKGQDDMQPPIGTPGAVPQTSGLATHADRGTSWMLPEAKGEDLLYITTGDNIYVWSYPAGSLTGILSVTANDICTDRKGDVYGSHGWISDP